MNEQTLVWVEARHYHSGESILVPIEFVAKKDRLDVLDGQSK